jgi:hypothetical protein
MPGRVVSIYLLRDPRTGNVRYVGQSLHGEGRLKGHFKGAESGSQIPVYRWIRKLTTLSLVPEWELQEEVLEEDWVGVEQWYIAAYRAAGCKLLNCTDGGEGCLGYKHTEEAKAKIGAKTKIRMSTPEAVARVVESNKTRVLSPETHKLMSESHSGHNVRPPISQAEIDALAERNRTRVWTPEMRAKASESARNRPPRPPTSEETKTKISTALTGRYVSPETKASMSAAQFRRQERERKLRCDE